MKQHISFAVCTATAATTQSLARFLHIWATDNCVDADIVPIAPAAVLAGLGRGAILFAEGASLPPHVQNELQAAWPQCGLVLLVSSPRIAIDAYRWHPHALLAQPFSYQSVTEAMERCLRYWRQGMRWLELPSNHRHIRVPLCRLWYLEALGRNTLLYCAGGKVQASCSIGAVQLPPLFLRCQKSFVVHLGAVRAMTGGELIMCDGRVIPVARTQRRQVQDVLAAFQRQRDAQEDGENADISFAL